MYGDIESFSVTKFLDETYPTEDDSENKQSVIDYMVNSLSDITHICNSDVDKFMESFILRISSLSELCKGVKDMDNCPIEAVSFICKSIDVDLKHILTDKTETLKICEGRYYLNLNSFPDAIKFYKYLQDNDKIGYSITRKKLENIYNSCALSSKFSNVLFTLSWLKVLRVYGADTIFFNYRCGIYT